MTHATHVFNCRRWPIAHAAAFLLLTTGLVMHGVPACAQSVYRCGSSYSHAPCTQGKSVDVADPRNPAQVQQARAQTARDQRLADQLHHENAAREAAHRQALQAEAKQAHKLALAQQRALRQQQRVRKTRHKLDTRKAVSPILAPTPTPTR
jgi:hypothetical protein